MRSIEELLETPYHIIDILPEQVKADGPGQYFAVERYWLEPSRLSTVKRKHVDLVLKLNCYRAVSLDEETEPNPDPERIAEAIMTRYVCIRIGDTLISSAPDDLYLTVYNADEALLRLLRTLCIGEGLYLWQPEQE